MGLVDDAVQELTAAPSAKKAAAPSGLVDQAVAEVNAEQPPGLLSRAASAVQRAFTGPAAAPPDVSVAPSGPPVQPGVTDLARPPTTPQARTNQEIKQQPLSPIVPTPAQRGAPAGEPILGRLATLAQSVGEFPEVAPQAPSEPVPPAPPEPVSQLAQGLSLASLMPGTELAESATGLAPVPSGLPRVSTLGRKGGGEEPTLRENTMSPRGERLAETVANEELRQRAELARQGLEEPRQLGSVMAGEGGTVMNGPQRAMATAVRALKAGARTAAVPSAARFISSTIDEAFGHEATEGTVGEAVIEMMANLGASVPELAAGSVAGGLAVRPLVSHMARGWVQMLVRSGFSAEEAAEAVRLGLSQSRSVRSLVGLAQTGGAVALTDAAREAGRQLTTEGKITEPGQIAKEGATGAALGAVMGGASGPISSEALKVLVQAVGWGTVGPLIKEGRLPTVQDLVLAGIPAAVIHAVTRATAIRPRVEVLSADEAPRGRRVGASDIPPAAPEAPPAPPATPPPAQPSSAPPAPAAAPQAPVVTPPRAAEPAAAAPGLPAWTRQAIDNLNGEAERLGIADKIEELAAQRMTANQIAKAIAPGQNAEDRRDLVGMIRAVRAKRQIPGLDMASEFEAWLKGRQAGAAPVAQAATPASEQKPAEESGSSSSQVPEPQPAPRADTEAHEVSSTQVDLPERLATTIRGFGATIPNDQLADGPKGREQNIHVTLLYGLDTPAAAPVRAQLEGQGPLDLELGKLGSFSTPEHDVLFVEVKSPALTALNAKLAGALPNSQDFPEYKPHVTIAYLKPGQAAQYVGRTDFEGQRTTVNQIAFHPKGGGESETLELGTQVPGTPAAGGRSVPPGSQPPALPTLDQLQAAERGSAFELRYTDGHTEAWVRSDTGAWAPRKGQGSGRALTTGQLFTGLDDLVKSGELQEGRILGPHETQAPPAEKPKPPAKVTPQVPNAEGQGHVLPEFVGKPHAATPAKDFTLPRELAGAKPRFNIGERSYEPQFADDLDKALYILAQAKPSARDADYLAAVRSATGATEYTIRALGRRLRERVKTIALKAEPGAIQIPSYGRRLLQEPVGSGGPATPAVRPPAPTPAEVPPAPSTAVAKVDRWEEGAEPIATIPGEPIAYLDASKDNLDDATAVIVEGGRGGGYELRNRDGEVLGTFDTVAEAKAAGLAKFPQRSAGTIEAEGTAKAEPTAAPLTPPEGAPTLPDQEAQGEQGVPAGRPSAGDQGALEEVPAADVSPARAGQETGSSPARGERADRPGVRPAGGGRSGAVERVGDGEGGVGVPAERAGSAAPAESAPDADITGADAGALPERPAADLTDPATPTPGQPPVVPGRDYVITADDHLGEGGPKQKYRDNVAAIQALKAIEAEGRIATPEEQGVLVRYVGWGGLAQVFDTKHETAYYKGKSDWAREYDELKDLLTAEEYEKARASTMNAHYTSALVISEMWKALTHMGYEGGKVLEPSAGVGHFLGLQPVDTVTSRTAVELEPLTGRILGALYPRAHVRVQGFETIHLPDNFFAVAIGNVPFGDFGVVDRTPNAARYSERGLDRRIHDYFLAKTLDKVRPGGLMAVITSAGTLDKRDKAARAYLAERGELLGAIRLPNTAFKGNAGTEVTTDVLFFRKRQAPITRDAAEREPWVESVERMDLVAGEKKWDNQGRAIRPMLNKHFTDHPEMVLGKLGADKLHPERIGVFDDGRDLADALHQAILTLPEGAMQPVERAEPETPEGPRVMVAAGETKLGGYAIGADGGVYRNIGTVDDTGRPVLTRTAEAMPATRVARIKGLLQVRDATREVIRGMQLGVEDADLKKRQQHLTRAYDGFVKKHGFIHEQGNSLALRGDPDYNLLAALEDWNPKTKKGTKSAIFTKRTIQYVRKVEKAEDPHQALLVSLNETGKIDWNRLEALTGKGAAELVKELAGRVYRNPEGGWETDDQYLAGDVRAKLKAAEAAAAVDAAYGDNATALKAVQPEDLLPTQIEARLGSPWVARDDIRAFVAETLGVAPSRVSVNYLPVSGDWSLHVDNAKYASTVEATRTWGTPEANAVHLIDLALNLQRPVVYVETPDGRRRDVQKTIAAEAAQDKVKDEFKRWVWSDDARAIRLARVYNDTFNNLRERQFDGSHLTFEGMSPEWAAKLRAHQKNAIWRGLQGENVGLAHRVGAGKTAVMVGTAMEARRLGLAKKPMLVVPNHMPEQIARDFMAMYPAANILVTQKGDLGKDKRRQFMSRIATGDWDAIVVPHSSFSLLPVTAETWGKHMTEQLAAYRDALEAAKLEGERTTVKRIEAQIERLEQKLEKRREQQKKQDRTIHFEELGVDLLFVDEAHYFKNLFVATKMTRVKGISATESTRAFDLFAKTQWLTEINGGRGVVFSTATPISNSVAEMFTMQRYLDYPTLKARGLANFDQWAGAFGETKSAAEMTPEGQFRVQTRFSKFSNVPELTALFRKVWDVQQDAEKLNITLPKLKTGKPIVHISPMSAAQLDYTQELIERVARIRKREVSPSEDNMLKVTSDGRKNSLDPRLVDASWPENPESKVNLLVKEAHDIWKRMAKDRAVQLIFLDLATPKSERSVERAALAKAAKGDQADRRYLLVNKVAAWRHTAQEVADRLKDQPGPKTRDDVLAHDGHRREVIKALEHGEDVRREVLADYPTLEAGVGLSAEAQAHVNKLTGKTAEVEEAETSETGDAPIIETVEEYKAREGQYGDIKRKLIAKGVPAEEIAFIHDAKTSLAKQRLFDDVNEGRVRILLGSTDKMGVGTNVQKRAYATHHVDAPWRPVDIEQRNGRFVRQGNMFAEVEEHHYISQGAGGSVAFDGFLWQLIRNKAQFINQVMRGDATVRDVEDVSDLGMTANEFMAMATGDPRILEKVNVDNELGVLDVLRREWENGLWAMKGELARQPARREEYARKVDAITQDIATRDEHKGPFAMKVGETEYTDRAAAAKAIPEKVATLPESMEKPQKIGEYRGFDVMFKRLLHPKIGNQEAFHLVTTEFRGAGTYDMQLSIESLESNVRNLEHKLAGARADLRETEQKLAKLQEEIGKPFGKQARYDELVAKKKALDAELVKSAGEGAPAAEEGGPPDAETPPPIGGGGEPGPGMIVPEVGSAQDFRTAGYEIARAPDGKAFMDDATARQLAADLSARGQSVRVQRVNQHIRAVWAKEGVEAPAPPAPAEVGGPPAEPAAAPPENVEPPMEGEPTPGPQGPEPTAAPLTRPDTEGARQDLFEREAEAIGAEMGARGGGAAPATGREGLREFLATPKGMADALKRALAPASRGPLAQEMAGVVRERAAELARETEAARYQFRKAAKTLDRLPLTQRYAFIDAIEQGRIADLPAEYRPIAEALREAMDGRRQRVQALGVGALERFIEDYFPHIWKRGAEDPEAIAGRFLGRRPLEGPRSFLKQRTIPTTRDGLGFGLEPVSSNPITLALLKIREMDRFLMGQRIFQEMKDQGLAQFVNFPKPPPEGYAKIDDRIVGRYQYDEAQGGFIRRGEYYVPEPAARVLNNYLKPGLRGNALYDAFRGTGNALNMVQLGFSFFHAGFVTMDTMISSVALGLQEASVGDPRAILSLATAPAAVFKQLYQGSKMLREYNAPGSQGAEMGQLVEGLVTGGGRARMERFYSSWNSLEQFAEAARQRDVLRMARHGLPAIVEAIAWPTMEYLVPRMKLGVFADMARFELGRLPANATEADARRVLGAAWDSVDNRLGQVVYDNLFWERWFKDLLMVAIRSVGWNLGTWREILGGSLRDLPLMLGHEAGAIRAAFAGEGPEAGRARQEGWRQRSGTTARLPRRLAYLLALPVVNAMASILAQYAYTGEGPQEWLDLIFPRTGRSNRDGTKARVSFPTYMKDLVSYTRDLQTGHPLKTLSHKIHPLLQLAYEEMWSNRDWRGAYIRDPDDPVIKQLWDSVKYAAGTFQPYALEGFKRQIESGLPPEEAAASFVGITQAPFYATHTPEQMRARELKQPDEKRAKRGKLRRDREPGIIERLTR